MHKIVLLLTLVIMGITSSFAQNVNTIIEDNSGYKTTYSCHGIELSERVLRTKIKFDSEAYNIFKKYKQNQTTGRVFSYAGAALFAFPIIVRIADGNPRWMFAGIGAGLFIISIPFKNAATKRKKSAIDLYNSHRIQSTAHQVEFNFGLNNYGVGVSMKF